MAEFKKNVKNTCLCLSLTYTFKSGGAQLFDLELYFWPVGSISSLQMSRKAPCSNIFLLLFNASVQCFYTTLLLPTYRIH